MVINRIEVFHGPGSRINRVYIFDKKTGCYLTRGYIKDEVLFVKNEMILKFHNIVIRGFGGRYDN